MRGVGREQPNLVAGERLGERTAPPGRPLRAALSARPLRPPRDAARRPRPPESRGGVGRRRVLRRQSVRPPMLRRTPSPDCDRLGRRRSPPRTPAPRRRRARHARPCACLTVACRSLGVGLGVTGPLSRFSSAQLHASPPVHRGCKRSCAVRRPSAVPYRARAFLHARWRRRRGMRPRTARRCARSCVTPSPSRYSSPRKPHDSPRPRRTRFCTSSPRARDPWSRRSPARRRDRRSCSPPSIRCRTRAKIFQRAGQVFRHAGTVLHLVRERDAGAPAIRN